MSWSRLFNPGSSVLQLQSVHVKINYCVTVSHRTDAVHVFCNDEGILYRCSSASTGRLLTQKHDIKCCSRRPKPGESNFGHAKVTKVAWPNSLWDQSWQCAIFVYPWDWYSPCLDLQRRASLAFAWSLIKILFKHYILIDFVLKIINLPKMHGRCAGFKFNWVLQQSSFRRDALVFLFQYCNVVT